MKMYYRLLQTNSKYMYKSYKSAKKSNLSLKDYETVWSDEIKVGDKSDRGAVAELIFMIFNSNKMPKGFLGRSMSVSDIVEIDGEYYYCDSYGFKKLNIDIVG